MTYLRLTVLATILWICESAIAQRWISYASTTDGFRIAAPGEFAIAEVDFETEYGIVVPARIFSHENDIGRYSVTIVDYRDAQRLHDERLEEIGGLYQPIYAQVDVRGSIAYAAKKIRDRASTIDYDAYHYIGRIEGHQLQTTNPDQTRTFAGLYLYQSRLYVIDATVSPNVAPPGMFQQSLEFIDEDGELITFRDFPEDRKVTGSFTRLPQ
ncbi:MAG: hypothetical protein ACR2QQ_04200 [Gammaproteobacteria bacterium]